MTATSPTRNMNSIYINILINYLEGWCHHFTYKHYVAFA